MSIYYYYVAASQVPASGYHNSIIVFRFIAENCWKHYRIMELKLLECMNVFLLLWLNLRDLNRPNSVFIVLVNRD